MFRIPSINLKRTRNLLVAMLFLGAQMPLFAFAPTKVAANHATAAPTVTATVMDCTPGTNSRDTVQITVKDNNNGNSGIDYTVTVAAETKLQSVANDSTTIYSFAPTTIGSHTASVTANNGHTSNTVTSAPFVINACTASAPTPAAPTFTVTVQACELDGDTDGVVVRVTNTDDATNASVTYTVTVGSVVKTITLADGVAGDVTFAGLPAGTHNVTVADSDNTSAAASTVTVRECGIDKKTELCHATRSATNPFEKIEVSVAAAFNGHLGDGNGDHREGEDIIPPFEYRGETYSQNWNAAGEATFNNNCVEPPTPAAPTFTVTVQACELDGDTDGVVVRVTNTDDATNASVTYTVTVGSVVKTITLADGVAGDVTFAGLPAGTHNVTVTGSDNTSAAASTVTVRECGIDKKTELCHATRSATNPFEKIEVSVAAAFNGHMGEKHQDGDDIIPPFMYRGQTYSQNWNAQGQATFNNNCVPVVDEEEIDEGDILGETIVDTNGRGSGTPQDSGEILGEQLVDTGSNILGTIFAAFAIIGLTLALALPTMKPKYE